jgi:HK97 family phage major capsid protein
VLAITHIAQAPPFFCFGAWALRTGTTEMANLVELQQEREKLLNEVREISERSTKAGKVTSDDKAAADVRSKRLDEIDEVMELQRSLDRTAGITSSDFGSGRKTTPNADGNRTKTVDPQAPVKAWLRGNYTTENLELVRSAGYNPESPILDFSLPGTSGLRANQTTSNTVGGYTIESRIYDAIVKETVTYGSVRSLAFQFQLDSVGSITVPTNNDTANEGELVAEEGAPQNQNNAVFGAKSIPLFMYNTGLPFKFSFQLLEDSKFDLVNFVEVLGVERILRAENRYFTLGTGNTSQPEGVTVGAQLYAQLGNGAANQAITAVTTDRLIAMQDDLDVAYDGNARWMFHKTLKTHLRTLKDGQNNYIWTQGNIQTGTPNLLLGKPFVENNHMATNGANAVPVLYGDFRAAYWVRNGMGFQFKRLVERYVEYGQVGLIGFFRSGGRVVKPSALRSLKLAETT